MQPMGEPTRSMATLVISRLTVALVGYLTLLFLIAIVFRDWKPFQEGLFSQLAALVPALCAALVMVLPRLFECRPSPDPSAQRKEHVAEPHPGRDATEGLSERAREMSLDREETAALR